MWDSILEYIGYLASVIVLVSLLMSSIKKLRWVNLIGSITFATYGFLIGSLPVGFLNIGTVCINVYYLVKMAKTKDYFKVLELAGSTVYLNYFLNFYKKDIEQFVKLDDVDIDKSDLSFYILRNVVPAGLFVSTKVDDHTLRVNLDYVVPMYRDFKMGSFIFQNRKDLFLGKGYDTLITSTDNKKHAKYLVKMGFVQDANDSNFFLISLK